MPSGTRTTFPHTDCGNQPGQAQLEVTSAPANRPVVVFQAKFRSGSGILKYLQSQGRAWLSVLRWHVIVSCSGAGFDWLCWGFSRCHIPASARVESGAITGPALAAPTATSA